MVTDRLFIESEFILKNLNKKLSLLGVASAGLLLLSGCVKPILLMVCVFLPKLQHMA